eukprot:Lithocolla_globosa_v1_NODE_1960_length_2238_cov_30.678424.p3 type:complete len:104 gc:universal NODE_1960_length_2238_cov_30.678424:1327-1638(+)
MRKCVKWLTRYAKIQSFSQDLTKYAKNLTKVDNSAEKGIFCDLFFSKIVKKILTLLVVISIVIKKKIKTELLVTFGVWLLTVLLYLSLQDLLLLIPLLIPSKY